MQKLLGVLVVLCVATALVAQEKTLIGKEIESGGYGGPVWKAGLVNGKTGVFSGGRGAWIINHKFAIGGGGYSLTTDVRSDGSGENGKPLYIQLEYGGFEMEFIHDSDKIVHWTFHTLFGGGSARLVEQKPDRTITSEKFYMVEPSVDLDFNVTSWFRFGIGAGYRVAMGLNLPGVANSDISGPSALIILKFGSF